MKKEILEALECSMKRIDNSYPINREVDFQSVLFGELYKALPEAIIRFEHILQKDYQSYRLRGRSNNNRKSRVDLYIQTPTNVIVIELKYFKGASSEDCTDMLADIAKVERIVESGEANEGFCFQLVKEGVVKRLPKGRIEAKSYKKEVGRWDYDFEIKGKYEITPELQANGRSLIAHHVQPIRT
ncbi:MULTISPECIES: hypothetical protein [Vibrio]|uniref:Uncharacterized protein n=1 Tax=Vibrio parahaemolyticus TaxID=670 RepID=A0AA46UGH1_VIBPH|nr:MULTISPECIES: hypothetical protein [Vibrio]UYV25277.1 hypothetical protein M5598_09370 [Vibrio parahaemolyticus]HCJ4876817.1 hypothetical protein [Vibrio parahaemolyticus]